jgi:hypothetical protein
MAGYADGLKITVAAPTEFQPSAGAAEPGQVAVRLSVTVDNGTSQPIDPSLITVGATSATAPAAPIVDPTNTINGAPDAALGLGQKVTHLVAFSVKDPEDVQVQVTPGLDREVSEFTT